MLIKMSIQVVAKRLNRQNQQKAYQNNWIVKRQKIKMKIKGKLKM